MKFNVIGTWEDVQVLKLYAKMHGWEYVESDPKFQKRNLVDTRKFFNLHFYKSRYYKVHLNEEVDRKEDLYFFCYTENFFETNSALCLNSKVNKKSIYEIIKDKDDNLR